MDIYPWWILMDIYIIYFNGRGYWNSELYHTVNFIWCLLHHHQAIQDVMCLTWWHAFYCTPNCSNDLFAWVAGKYFHKQLCVQISLELHRQKRVVFLVLYILHLNLEESDMFYLYIFFAPCFSWSVYNTGIRKNASRLVVFWQWCLFVHPSGGPGAGWWH